MDGYVAIMAYLDRRTDKDIQELQNLLAKKTGKPITFGWGPRLLHSTGQFHKGGQPNGSFLQITADCEKDFEVPGKGFTFQTLLMAQAIGDQNALAKRGLKTTRLHLTNRKEGIAQLLATVKSL
jgi:glucose-6-phosphate isomerase